MSSNPEIGFLGYIPVYSRNVKDLLDNVSPRVDTIGLIEPESIANDIRPVAKDRRALTPEELIEVLGDRYPTLQAVGSQAIEQFLRTPSLIMPDDEITKFLLEHYGRDPQTVELDRTFYRWQKKSAKANQEITGVEVVDINQIDPLVVDTLAKEREHSMDWWRQVAAVVTDEQGNVLSAAHNTYVPDLYSAEIDGDMRSNFKRGQDTELSNAIHAEANAIANLARRGIATEGLVLHCTTFTCNTCANLVATSGFSKLYFYDGYTVADGQAILRNKGVNIIRVNHPNLF